MAIRRDHGCVTIDASTRWRRHRGRSLHGTGALPRIGRLREVRPVLLCSAPLGACRFLPSSSVTKFVVLFDGRPLLACVLRGACSDGGWHACRRAASEAHARSTRGGPPAVVNGGKPTNAAPAADGDVSGLLYFLLLIARLSLSAANRSVSRARYPGATCLLRCRREQPMNREPTMKQRSTRRPPVPVHCISIKHPRTFRCGDAGQPRETLL